MSQELNKEQLLQDVTEMRAKLQTDHERTSFETPKGSLNGMMHTVDYGGVEPQHTVMNLQTGKVAYIGFESDTSLEKGIERAKHYNQWALESENLDGNRTGITADTINVTTMSSNPNLQGYLTSGTIPWPNKDMLIHTTFPKADAEAAAKNIDKLNKVTEDLLYDFKADAIVNPYIEGKEIPIEVWTQGKADGFTQAANGNLEHVGGYIASMAGVTPEDAKKLLSPKQTEQYFGSEIKGLADNIHKIPFNESYEKMLSLVKGLNIEVKMVINEDVRKKLEAREEKDKSIKVSRSRERGSGLGR